MMPKYKRASVLWIGMIISPIPLKVTIAEYSSAEQEEQQWSVLTLSPSVLHSKAIQKTGGLAQQ